MALQIRCEKGHSYIQADIVVGRQPGEPACPTCAEEWYMDKRLAEITAEQLFTLETVMNERDLVKRKLGIAQSELSEITKQRDSLFMQIGLFNEALNNKDEENKAADKEIKRLNSNLTLLLEEARSLRSIIAKTRKQNMVTADHAFELSQALAAAQVEIRKMKGMLDNDIALNATISDRDKFYEQRNDARKWASYYKRLYELSIAKKANKVQVAYFRSPSGESLAYIPGCAECEKWKNYIDQVGLMKPDLIKHFSEVHIGTNSG